MRGEIQCKVMVPSFGFGIQQVRTGGISGIVNPNINSSQMIKTVFCELFNGLLIGDIRLKKMGLCPFFSYRFSDGFSSLLIIVCNDDMGSFLGKSKGGSTANSATGSGDNSTFVK